MAFCLKATTYICESRMKTNSLLNNSLLNFLSQVLNFSVGFFISVMLARYFGAEQMGYYSYLIQLLITTSLIFSLGVPRALTRFVANFAKSNQMNKVKQLIFVVLRIECVLSIIIAFTGVLISTIFLDSNRNYLIISLALPIFILNNVVAGILQGLQKYDKILRISLEISILNLVSSFSLILLGLGLVEILILTVFLQAVSLFLSTITIRGFINFATPHLEKNTVSDITKYTFVTSIIVLIDLILMERSEVFFLKFFSNVKEVAFYSISFGLVYRLMALVPGSISGVILPVIAGLHGLGDSLGIQKIYFKTTRYLVAITLPIVFAGLGLIDLFINLVYGKDYLPMISSAQVLLLSGGLTAIVAGASSAIYGINKQGVILKIGLLMVIINLGLDFLLIPKFGSFGAALANSMAQIFAVIVGTFYIVKIQKMPFPIKGSIQALIAALAALLVVLLLKKLILLSLFLELSLLSFIFISIYLLILILVKFFDNQDLEIFRKILKITAINNGR